jgi:hypothetical protein
VFRRPAKPHSRLAEVAQGSASVQQGQPDLALGLDRSLVRSALQPFERATWILGNAISLLEPSRKSQLPVGVFRFCGNLEPVECLLRILRDQLSLDIQGRECARGFERPLGRGLPIPVQRLVAALLGAVATRMGGRDGQLGVGVAEFRTRLDPNSRMGTTI